jgi:broad specificity phosphatase PhoE
VRLLLLRHGETEGNLGRQLQGPEDPLTERGRRQAGELAAHLAGRGDVAALYASPLGRALETARIVGEAVGLEPTPRPALAEIDVGRAAGIAFDDWRERFPEEFSRFEADGVDYEWPGGESGRQLASRASTEIERIIREHSEEPGAVAVVSHGGALAWVISHLLGEPDDRWPREHMGLENCSVTEVEVRADGEPRATFIRRNEIGHLSPDPDAEVATGHEPR